MDREISRSERRRRLARRLGFTAAVIALLTVLLILLFSWIRPSVRREDLRTAMVERGPVEATVIGNVLMQALGAGCIKSLAEGRAIVSNSFAGKQYQPGNAATWEAYRKKAASLPSIE